MPHRRPLLPLVVSLLVMSAFACGRAQPAAESGEAAGPAADAPAAQPAPAAPSPAEPTVLTAADLDAYERGVQAELDALRRAAERLKAATTADDTLNAIGDALPANLQKIGAQGAGMALERWTSVSRQIEAALQARAGSAMMARMAVPQGVDTASLPPEARARVRENLEQMQAQAGQQEAQAYASLPPDLVETFKARAPHLDSLRLRLAGAQMSLGR
ncbi:MAG: hypothetical protein IRZ00_14410 [Gemmatimonadetes bacterium]|nr:hypothetical protein [Gemmatimonadota bacterium]